MAVAVDSGEYGADCVVDSGKYCAVYVTVKGAADGSESAYAETADDRAFV